MHLLGAEVVEVGEGTCVVEVTFAEGVTQQESYLHGAVTGAIVDTAGGYAAMTLAPPDREVLTVEYKVNFLAPAHGEKLVARGGTSACARPRCRRFRCGLRTGSPEPERFLSLHDHLGEVCSARHKEAQATENNDHS